MTFYPSSRHQLFGTGLFGVQHENLYYKSVSTLSYIRQHGAHSRSPATMYWLYSDYWNSKILLGGIVWCWRGSILRGNIFAYEEPSLLIEVTDKYLFSRSLEAGLLQQTKHLGGGCTERHPEQTTPSHPPPPILAYIHLCLGEPCFNENYEKLCTWVFQKLTLET